MAVIMVAEIVTVMMMEKVAGVMEMQELKPRLQLLDS
jgi:hypothetical protein